ncbi:MAG: heme ABC transporter ATP-binding protein, partial [Actinomycetota bacterium]|nr:heme ABC transporter ATP-binding protein [Actinomycetota bacterium]
RDLGTATLLISEDLDEVLGLADRIAVMYEGRIVGIVPVEEARRNQIGLMMAGVPEQEARNSP